MLADNQLVTECNRGPESRHAISAVMLAEAASRPWVGCRADQVDLRAYSPLIIGSWSQPCFRGSLVPGWPVSGRLGRAGRRARQRAGVEVPDLVDALGELPAVRGAPVAVVVDAVVQ